MRRKLNDRKMRQGVRLLLEGMGLDLSDPDFKDTPARVSRMYQELLQPKRIDTVASFPDPYKGMITLRDHVCYAICPHHLQPVSLTVSIGYVPDKVVMGLSKLARIAESVLTEPIKQETFTDMVAAMIYQHVEPLGCGVYVVGEHGCMKYRGVMTSGDVVTSAMRGCFFVEAKCRQEFISMVERRR